MSNYKLRCDNEIFEQISKHSLLRQYANMYSECGQDGILNYIFTKIGIQRGLFVEFGGWDGCYLSNCRALLMKGWDGVYIECDKEKFLALRKNCPENVTCINAMVGLSSNGKSLETILTENNVILNEVTFISIDVDGPDLEIFEELSIKPPVILLEGGFNYNPKIQKRVNPDYAFRNNQHPLGAVIEKAKTKGYQCVCFFQDSYLVRDDYAHLFNDQVQLGTQKLYEDAWHFASDILKNYLLEFRRNDPYLVQFETEQLGSFNPSPI